MAVSNRTFGIEIECGHDRLDEDDVEEAMADAGFPTGYSPREYEFDRDGSGIEIKTPILKGESGYKEVFRVMDFLNDLGCWVSRSDGMHVHVGAKQLYRDEKACAALARTWYNNQAIIGRMCSSHRTGHTHSARVTKKEAETLGQTTSIDEWYDFYERKTKRERVKEWGGRKSLNFGPLEDIGTIEFRLHEGCLDPVKAVAWVKFCQKLVDHSARERKAISCAKSKTALLTTLSVPRDATAILARRQPLMPAARR